MSNQRKKAEDWLFHISNDESWIDASSEAVKASLSEAVKASLTALLDQVRAEAREGMVYGHGCSDIESGLLDD